MPKRMAQYATRRECRQYGVHDFGAILLILSALWILGNYVGHIGDPGNSPSMGLHGQLAL